MSPKELIDVLGLCRDSEVPLMIWGHHGMGKSSIVRQFADNRGVQFVDFRCAQIESSDLRGFPTKRKTADGTEVTSYCIPEDLPRSGEGVLFLDEINRADDPVIQAAFQLIVERKIGTYSLPDGWQVVCACNYTEGYHVNDLGAAFIGRFCHVELSMSNDYLVEWAEYVTRLGNPGTEEGDEDVPESAKRLHESALNVVAFLGQETRNICSKRTAKLDFNIEPSPRLWTAVARVLSHKHQYEKSTVDSVIGGLIGHEIAIEFNRASFLVKPKDVVEKGLKDVLEDLKKCEKTEQQGLVWSVATYTNGLKSTKKRHAVNVLDYMEYLIDNKMKDMATVLVLQVLRKHMKADGAAVMIKNQNIAKYLSNTKSSAGINVWVNELQSRNKLYEMVKAVLATK